MNMNFNFFSATHYVELIKIDPLEYSTGHRINQFISVRYFKGALPKKKNHKLIFDVNFETFAEFVLDELLSVNFLTPHKTLEIEYGEKTIIVTSVLPQKNDPE